MNIGHSSTKDEFDRFHYDAEAKRADVRAEYRDRLKAEGFRIVKLEKSAWASTNHHRDDLCYVVEEL